MPVTLYPRNYKQGLSWRMLPKNKIDTVTCKPIINNQLSSSVIHTENITSVNVAGSTYTLPLANSVSATHRNAASNMLGDVNMATCRVEVTLASGTFSIHLDHPLLTTPTVKLRFEGTTKYMNRNARSFDTMTNLFDSPITNFAGTIDSNADGEETWSDSKSIDSYNRGGYDDPSLIDYSKAFVTMYPFVRVKRPAGSGVEGWTFNKLSPQDVLTHWINPEAGYNTIYCAEYNNWTGKDNPNAWATWDSVAYATVLIDFNSQRASFVDKNVPIITNIAKESDYDYTVTWSAPVRYAYHAESRGYTSILGIRTYHDVDCYAFLDKITKIVCEVSAQVMNTDSVDLSYSLNGSALTTDVINDYPISFDANEFITLDTYLYANEIKWTQALPLIILQSYKNGKYIVECEVYINWAITNNIGINSQLYVVLQDGTFISREGTNVLFEVKTIEKSFKANEFTYILRLLEV